MITVTGSTAFARSSNPWCESSSLGIGNKEGSQHFTLTAALVLEFGTIPLLGARGSGRAGILSASHFCGHFLDHAEQRSATRFLECGAMWHPLSRTSRRL